MTVADDIALLEEAKDEAKSAMASLDAMINRVDWVTEPLSREINRMVLVRGDHSITTLDQAIGNAEGAMARAERLTTELSEIREQIEASMHMAATYQGRLTR